MVLAHVRDVYRTCDILRAPEILRAHTRNNSRTHARIIYAHAPAYVARSRAHARP